MAEVPLLITWDVDPSPKLPVENKVRSLALATALCDDLGIRATFFVTARAPQATRETLGRIQASGHEIGCHGLTHGDEENYDRMPEELQRAYIAAATERLTELAGRPIRAFRSPRVKTSGLTLSILAEHGYRADSSVCPQRVDLVSSNLLNIGWVFAPRGAYRPARRSAFRRGTLAIWEVPIAAAIVPFISASLSVFGLTFMKALFRLLYAESRRTGRPIVYLAHPTEFTAGRQRKFHLREFSPAHIRAHGLLVRNLLYRMGQGTWLRATRELFSYMASFPGVVFSTVSDYVSQLPARR
ncbi:MAG TPA: hypothetical protein ENK17_03440 [Anaerolineae bacterium]|nr:hypothetical protein [Anaerolineae bacterium]